MLAFSFRRLGISMFLLLISLGFKSFSQNITNYTYTAFSQTYTPVGTSGVTTLFSGSGQFSPDVSYNNNAIGFDFWYMGNRYTHFALTSNGWLVLGTSGITAPDRRDNDATNGRLSTSDVRPMLAPLFDDLYGVGSDGASIAYKNEDISGVKVLTVEWKLFRWRWNTASPCLSFQVKLFSTGEIVFNYGQNTNPPQDSPTATVGISGPTSGQYLSLNNLSSTATASSTVLTNSISAAPANNQAYRFDPVETSAPTSLRFTQVGTTGMDLSWTDNSTDEKGFAIYRSTNNVTFSYIGQTSANVASFHDTSLTAGTTYYYRIYAIREDLSTALSGSKATVSACSTSTVTLSQVSSANIVANYNMNGTGTDFYGNNPGTLQGSAASATDRFDVTGAALNFDGVDDYFSTTNLYTNPNNFTISVWFKTTSNTGAYLIGFASNQTAMNPGNSDRHIYLNAAGNVYFGVYSSAFKVIGSADMAYNDGNWHLASASMSSTEGMKLYVDGVLKASDATVLSTLNYAGYWRMGALSVGTSWPNRPTSTYLAGSLDDAHIYNRVLSASEISQLYISEDGVTNSSPVCAGDNISFTAPTLTGATYSWTGPGGFSSSVQNPTLSSSTARQGVYSVSVTYNGCTVVSRTRVSQTQRSISQVSTANIVAHYKLNGNANDFYGNNPGTLQGGPTPTTDRYGVANSAYNFNGTSQYITTLNQYTNPGNLTLAAWFKSTATDGGYIMGFVGDQTALTGSNDRHVYLGTDGKLHFGIYISGVGAVTIGSSSTYNDGNWHFVAASLSSTDGMKLYVDGAQVSSDPTVSAEPTTSYWRIAAKTLGAAWINRPTGSYFSGDLDDIHIYHRTLSAAEISQLYRSEDGVTNSGPTCAGTNVSFTAPTIAGATYSWSGPNSFSSTLQNPTLSYTAAAAGVYTVTVTANGCAIASRTLLSGPTVQGQWTGNVNTSWGGANNWCDGLVPGAAIDATIPTGLANYPVVTANSAIRNLNIQSGASVSISNAYLSISGSVTNNGTLTASDGGLTYNGSVAQSIPPGLIAGNLIKNLTINNTAGVALQDSLRLTGILTASAGVFDTGGHLTLASDSASTAQVATVASGASIIGQVRAERYISGGDLNPYRTYRMLSSPVYDNTENFINSDSEGNRTVKFSQLQDDMIITGTGGAANVFDSTHSNQAGAWIYSESAYHAIDSINTAVNIGRGMYLFYRGNRDGFEAKTVSPFVNPESIVANFVGVLNQQDVSVSLDYEEGTSGTGFNLVGNPYAAVIDWDSTNWGSDRVNLRDAIWIWQPDTRSYATYAGGIGTLNGSRYIAPGQSFFVQTTADGGSIKFKENIKTPNVAQPALLMVAGKNNAAKFSDGLVMDGGNSNNSPRSLLRVNMQPQSSYGKDELVLIFDENSTAGYDENDALHFNGEVVNIASVAAGGQKLAVNFHPKVNNVTEIQLDVAAQRTGSYTMQFNLAQYFDGNTLQLKDSYLNQVSPIGEGFSYNFNIDRSNPQTFGANRFSIIVAPPAVLPVGLINFTAKIQQNGVLLSWATSYEVNNELFKLYRAGLDGQYVFVGSVPAKGAGNYTFTDAKPLLGHNHYKLVQVDLDGKETEAGPVSVNFNANLLNAALIYPNPAKDKFTIRMADLPSKGRYSLKLYDLLGQRLAEHEVSGAQLSLGYEVQVAPFANGLIFIRVEDEIAGNVVLIDKVIKN